VTVLRVPYHLDEYLPDLDLPDWPAQTITAELPPGDTWARLAVLYGRVADAVASAVGDGTQPVVLSGDCTTSLGTMAGLQQAGLDPGIVWFDAHGDVQTLQTTYLAGAAIGRAEVTGLDPAVLPDGPLYVHLDLDVIDPAVLPGLRYPAPGTRDTTPRRASSPSSPRRW
jgi:arginase